MQNSRFFSSFFNVFLSKFLLATLDKIVRHCSLTVLATAPCPIPITAGIRSISYSPKLLKQSEIPTEISDMSMSPIDGGASRVLPLQLPTTGPPVPDRGAGCQRSSSPPCRSCTPDWGAGCCPHPTSSLPHTSAGGLTPP